MINTKHTATAKLSSKYQIVIPKELRSELKLKPGQRMSISLDKNHNISIATADPLTELKGKYAGKWGSDPVAYLRKQRDQWDKH